MVAVTAVLIAAAVSTTSSRATFPGKNGPIVFRRYLGANQTRGVIFTIGVDGRHERRVTRPSGANDEAPDWSPDASLIAFRRERGPDGAIYTVRPDGSELSRVSPACSGHCQENYTPAFSPDGRRLAYASLDGRKWSVVVVSLDDGSRAFVVRAPSGVVLDGPQFSPDGQHLIFVQYNRHKAPRGRRAVFEVRLDGSGKRRVTPWSLVGGDSPDWSPDGKWILFRSNEDLDRQSQIYVIHPNGRGLKKLTHFKAGTAVTSSSFSPDGRWIVFGASGIGGQADLYLMRRNGKGIRPLTRTRLWDSAPDWGSAR